MKPLILWGGEDVWPGCYGADPHPKSGPFNPKRDVNEIDLVKAAMALDQPIVGVCRGAQLLCVMNGGTLWQHSLGHNNNNHGLVTRDGYINSAAADHHQIMRPDGKYELLAWDDTPTHVYGEKDTDNPLVIARVPEVIWWPETKCLAIQPHPEWEDKDSPFVKWINNTIYTLIGEEGVF